MSGRPAAGGGRWVEVAPERLERWLDGFADRHGGVREVVGDSTAVRFEAADGAVAECHPPFGPLASSSGDPRAALLTHALLPRRVGVLLVRLGGFAVGVFDGDRLVASKVDTRLVHGRHKKGGSSQQRFARRREGQVRELTQAAADVVARVLLPELASLDAVVAGGDRSAVTAVLADGRLAAVVDKLTDRFLTVPDPRRAVLDGTPALFRAVHVRLTEPPG
ncbi:MAG TPA: acVLRF1 family peptidyl-tRNA hydrolase [Cryptosporangiaceae bacterium]|nr:acVLRF1 family peptidyl-tRNA hydrolase [Cryptosporangiaceae bacterium]